MKKELENLLYDCVLENQEEYPVKEILEKYTTDILNLFNKTIEESEREITDYLIHATSVGTTAARAIINIIKNEIGKDK